MHKVEFSLMLLFVYILLCPQVLAQQQEPSNCNIEASIPSGIYYKPYSLILISACENCNIRYTLDGKEPNAQSNLFKNPIVVEKNTIINAACYNAAGKKISNSKTFSYIFDEQSNLPIVSLVLDPHHLFNPATGLFIGHKPPGSGTPPKKANYKSNRRVLAYIDFFEVDKSHQLWVPSEFKLFGGYSRMFAQKSIALRPNEKLGFKRYHYPFFTHRPYLEYKDIVLRNSGSDWGAAHFRDALVTSLGHDIGLITQAYRPTIVYINGKFWGIYNLRERISKTFIARYGQVHKDSIDFMEHRAYVNEGSSKHYDKMKDYMRNRDMSKEEHFDYIATQMEVLQFLDYQSIQIFIDNKDAGGNIKYFRGQKNTDKWNWILYDTDYAFGHAGALSHFNSLAFHIEANGPRWPNPPWSTFIFRNLLKSEKGKRLFVSRFLDRMNTTLAPSYIEERIDSIVALIKADMPRHIERWNLSLERWEREILKIKTFVKDRPIYMRKYLLEVFPQYGKNVYLQIINKAAAPYQINNHLLNTDTLFGGIYFSNLDLHLEAIGRKGQNFLHWKIGDSIISNETLVLKIQDFTTKDSIKIEAIFAELPSSIKNSIVLKNFKFESDIRYNALEIYNISNDSIFIGGWQLKNNYGESFALPQIYLSPKSSWYFSNDLDRYKLAYEHAQNVSFCNIPIQDNLFLQTPNGEKAPLYNVGLMPSESAKDTQQVIIKDIRKSELDSMQPSTEKASNNNVLFSLHENENIDLGLKAILVIFSILAGLFLGITFYLKKKYKD